MINSPPNCILWEKSPLAETGTMKQPGQRPRGHASVERTFCQETHMLKPPKSLLQITIYTHVSHGDQAHFTHWKIPRARPECIPPDSPWGWISFSSSSSSSCLYFLLCVVATVQVKTQSRPPQDDRACMPSGKNSRNTLCTEDLAAAAAECWLCAQCHHTSSALLIYFLLTPQGRGFHSNSSSQTCSQRKKEGKKRKEGGGGR